jgi:protein-S-isoprenylcysteine O-methyltransferase Ste14
MGWARRVVPPVWLLIALLAALALQRFIPLAQLWQAPVNRLGLLPLAGGLALVSSGVRSFRRRGTPLVPLRPSTTLVTTGVYRFTRNPMYLGLALIQLGCAWLLGSLGAFVPLPLLVWILQSGYIDAEERFLEQLFGAEYQRYKSDVRRWI